MERENEMKDMTLADLIQAYDAEGSKMDPEEFVEKLAQISSNFNKSDKCEN